MKKDLEILFQILEEKKKEDINYNIDIKLEIKKLNIFTPIPFN